MKILFKDSPYHSQRQYEKPVWIYPAHLSMFATHLRNHGDKVVWFGKDDGSFDRIIDSDLQIDVDFDKLPIPDRIFTNAMNPKYLSYGNYRKRPASHYLSSNLCWYGKCSFCVDTERLQKGEKRGLRSVDHVISEIDNCIDLGFRELFDDAGTLPVGEWLTEFCLKMRQNYKGKRRCDQIRLGANMKPVNIDYKMMADAGFRFILVGVESANQKTLDKICKGQKADKTIEILKAMSKAGLYPHLTSMFGYEWETEEDAQNTLDLIHYLLRKGYVKTAQASVYSPPRTRPDSNSAGHKYIPMVYDVLHYPDFWWNKIKDIQDFDDVRYMLRGARLIAEEKWRKLCLKK